MKANKNSFFQDLLNGKRLSKESASQLMKNITAGQYNEAQLASMLSTFYFRKPSYEEILGFQEALLQQCIPLNLPFEKVLDMCGTGGDGKSSFNISTLSAFIVAAAGCKVAKHGNNGVSSVCGSSNVLQALGYEFKKEPNALIDELGEMGITFLHAPFFHPALRAVSQVRKQLGVKTIFNLLGPLVHPSQPKFQLTGVYHLEVARLYNYVLSDCRNAYMVIHSLDGYDELSLTGPAKYFSHSGQGLLHPEDLVLSKVSPEKLLGGKNIKAAARIFLEVLQGKGLPEQKQVVCANAALAYRLIHPSQSLLDAYRVCLDVLEGGKAYELFKKISRKVNQIAIP